MEKAFVDTVISDLRVYCADLLHQATATSANSSSLEAASSPSDLGDLAFTRLTVNEVRRALDEHWRLDDGDDLPERTPLPARARAPRNPSGWIMTAAGATPRYWIRPALSQQVDARELEWVIALVNASIERAHRAVDRLKEGVADARSNITSDSGFARDAVATLEATCLEAEQVRDSALRLRRELISRRVPGRRAAPADAVPPLDPAWARLRELGRIAGQDGVALSAGLARALTPPVPLADLPFLYQRWVGLQLVRAIERAGFSGVGDPRIALFLGGHVRFFSGDDWIEMWVESRLAKGHPHPSGLATEAPEVSPDFIIAVPGDQCRDFYVLDATLGVTHERLRKKCDYKKRCHVDVPGAAAGWTIRRRPIRAWAIAPLSKRVELMSEDGSEGALGLDPASQDFRHLDAWMNDVVRHGRAWKATDAHRSAVSVRPGPS